MIPRGGPTGIWLSILLESYCNQLLSRLTTLEVLLSILLESYCNSPQWLLASGREASFNSSRVLLQRSRQGTATRRRVLGTFNSSRVLLQLFSLLLLFTIFLAFNSSRVLLQRKTPSRKFQRRLNLSILLESYCNCFSFCSALYVFGAFNSSRVLLQHRHEGESMKRGKVFQFF